MNRQNGVVSPMKTIGEHIEAVEGEFRHALSDHIDGKVRYLTEEMKRLLDH